jgi:hypothetical protein
LFVHGENGLKEAQNFLDGINKIKMILKAGGLPSANPINHINPIPKPSLAFSFVNPVKNS